MKGRCEVIGGETHRSVEVFQVSMQASSRLIVEKSL